MACRSVTNTTGRLRRHENAAASPVGHIASTLALMASGGFLGKVIIVLMLTAGAAMLASCGGAPAQHVVATFAPAGSQTGAVSEDVPTIDHRLTQLGYAGATARVKGDHVVVEAQKALPHSDLQALTVEGDLQLRPLLCFAPPFMAGTQVLPQTLPTTCYSTNKYALIASNLHVDVTTGQPTNTMQPDPTLALYPSSTPEYNDANPHAVVLLSAAPNSGVSGTRYLLGPAGVTNAAIQSAVAQRSAPYGPAVVVITLTSEGAAQWDALADEQFHAYVAMDVDGVVDSAPLTEPTQNTFSSFGGKVEISGNFTQASAQSLAAELDSGPLAVALQTAP